MILTKDKATTVEWYFEAFIGHLASKLLRQCFNFHACLLEVQNRNCDKVADEILKIKIKIKVLEVFCCFCCKLSLVIQFL